MRRFRWARTRREGELDEEIQAHFDMAIEERMARGETRRDAELAVRREFGNRPLVTELTREIWGAAYVWISSAVRSCMRPSRIFRLS